MPKTNKASVFLKSKRTLSDVAKLMDLNHKETEYLKALVKQFIANLRPLTTEPLDGDMSEAIANYLLAELDLNEGNW